MGPTNGTYVAGGSDTAPVVTLNLGAADKLRGFAAKCGPAGRSAITLAQEWEFRPWIIDVYGGMHSSMREDVHGLSAFIAEGRAGRRVSPSMDAATVASTANDILYWLQLRAAASAVYFL